MAKQNKMPSIPEDVEQTQLFAWAAYASGRYPELELMHHIPNGGKRDKIAAAKLRAQGVKRGIPDIFLPVPRGGAHGLYIELKRADGGTLSAEQKEIIPKLLKQGYEVAVCHGAEQAISVITRYLQQEGK